MRRIIIGCCAALALVLGIGTSRAQDEAARCLADIAAKNPLPHQEWDFNSVFGTYDQATAQRGFQVYKEV